MFVTVCLCHDSARSGCFPNCGYKFHAMLLGVTNKCIVCKAKSKDILLPLFHQRNSSIPICRVLHDNDICIFQTLLLKRHIGYYCVK